MSLTQLFYRKLKLQMKLLHIVDKKPKHIIKLDPIDNEDFTISLESVAQWSQDNHQLYELILASGMAEFICNREYLYEFYRHLDFSNQNVIVIDEDSLHFKHLKVLNLTGCNIKVIQNIPHNCKQLYLDFNLIEDINNRQPNTLELLSLSHNAVDDAILAKIVGTCKQLRCLNISWNSIAQLRQFVELLNTLEKLKILVVFGNPISMLAIYYSYITEHLKLGYFDGNKYVKVEQVKKQEPKVEEKKEVVKEEKKDAKKDNKKGAKVEEKPVEEPPKIQQKIQVKRQLTNQDFQKVKLTLQIGNIQQFTGNAFDPSLFPADFDIKKTQTNYWFKCELFGTSFEEKDKIIAYDNATIQNQETRLNLAIKINKEISVNFNTFQSFNDSIKVQVHQIEPKMVKDAQTLELKPEVVNGQIAMTSYILGATFIDLRSLHIAQKKQLKYKYRLFNINAVDNSLFLNPYEDQAEQIKSKKQKFQNQLKKKEEERVKKLEQQELLKQQKKGGAKDQKKGTDKKASKKEGKDAVVTQKRKSQKCDFPIHERQYCILEDNKMYKGKQLLCVRVLIQ